MVDYDKIKEPKNETGQAVFKFGVIVLIICALVGVYFIFNNAIIIGISTLCGGVFQFVFWSSLSEIINLLYNIKTKL